MELLVLMWLDDVCGVGQKTTSSTQQKNIFDQVDQELQMNSDMPVDTSRAKE